MATAYIDNDIIEELYECVPHNDDTPDEIFETNCQKKMVLVMFYYTISIINVINFITNIRVLFAKEINCLCFIKNIGILIQAKYIILMKCFN